MSITPSPGPQKVIFTIIIPVFNIDSFDSTVRNVFIAAVQTAAILCGASTAPEVTIQSVKAATKMALRRILYSAAASSTGVILETGVIFDASDASAVTNFISLLQLAPRTAFPASIFGSVTVPDVRVGKISSNKSTTIGLAVGLSVGFAAVAGIIAAAVIKHRKSRLGRTDKAPSILGKRKLLSDNSSPLPARQVTLPTLLTASSSALPMTPTSPSAYSDQSEEGGSLRELYQAKQQLAGRAGLSNPGSQTPTRPPLSQLNNDIMSTVVVFDNPLAEVEEESSEENERTYNFPTPSRLTNWFRESRAKSLERKRQKFMVDNNSAANGGDAPLKTTPKSSEFDVMGVNFAKLSLNEQTGKQAS